jgi:diguanylate cyclase (GGDEF)-like protein
MGQIIWIVVGATVALTLALFAVLWSIIRHDLWLPLQYQADHDDLTGLRRPASFWAACTQQVAAAVHGQYALAFVFVDLDNFKAINDQHGHAVGDSVLQAAGRVFRDAARTTDVLGRLGGEEFGWVLPGATAREAALATERVLEGWQSLTIAGLSGLTFSAGVASMTGHEAVALSAWDLARAADRALYQAKAAGKARVALADRAS